MGLWDRPTGAVPIEASQVVVGLYVWLDLSWTEHPFVTNRFRVKTVKEVATIQSLDVAGRLYYLPDKSEQTLPPVARALAPDQAQLADRQALVQEVKRLEKAKKDKIWAEKDAATRAQRAWESAATGIRDALLTMAGSPKVAGAHIKQVSLDNATQVAQGKDMLLHLLGDSTAQGPQFHALNTMTLSLLLGKKAGLNERELADLAMAALAHDAGKSEVPLHILKNAQRKKHEEEFYRQHVHHSVQLASQSGSFSPAALTMIADHHETLDGLGWPQKKSRLSPGARILALVNRYDRLCTPEAAGKEPMVPAEALATLFRREAGKYDPALMALLIKLLGVYPPGTVVQLNDDSLALVVAPGQQSLQPKVLIYSPERPKDDAPVLELATAPDLKIVSAIRPGTLTPEVLAWLNPQQRLAYHFTVSDQ
ncbi:MAG: hypothetical protein RIS90_1854 [Pseudomonadota bacterium]